MSQGDIRIRLPVRLLDELVKKDFAGGGLATSVFSGILVIALTEFRSVPFEELQERFDDSTPRKLKMTVNRLIKEGWVERLEDGTYTVSDRVREIYREYEVGTH